jgi:PAS domain S-box-containing protein
MFSKMALSLKGSLILAITLIIQLSFILSLVLMHSSAVDQIKEELRTQSVIAGMNRVSNLWSNLGADSFRMMVFPTPGNQSPIKAYRTQFAYEFSSLKEKIDDPEIAKEVSKLRTDTNASLDMAVKLKEAWDRHDDKDFHSLLKEGGYLSDLCTARSNKLIDKLIEHQQNLHKAQELSQTTLNIALVVGLALNFLIVLAIGYLFTREIAGRIAQIEDNSIRLKSGMILQPVLAGDDEIARLDQDFHKMSDALVAQTIKERAVIDNALDLICSLDTSAVFIMANPASELILGRKPNDILGLSYMEFVLPEDRERLQSLFIDSIAGLSVAPFEHKVMHTNGTVVELEMSVHWSDADKTLFCVMHDVSKRRQLERMKREFADTITKDLRKPLVSTRETLAQLASGSFDTVTATSQVQAISEDIKPMLKLISDLLEAEKFDADMLSLDLKIVQTSSIVEESILSVQSAAEEKSIKLDLTITDVWIEADEQRVTQALVKLLSNAIAVSPTGGLVSLDCKSVSNSVRFEVGDSGPHVPADEIELMFEPFRRTPETGSERQDVTGLGLLICKSIVEAHHGTIVAVSNKQQGCVFWMEFPVNQPKVS